MNCTEPMMPERDELIPTRLSLIQRLNNWKDQSSWQEFFDTYWRLIFSTAIRSGLTETEAQDVVQETVISVCKSIGRFHADPALGSFKGWLLQIVRRRVVDQVRKRLPSKPPVPRAELATSTTDRVPDPARNELERVWEEEWKKNLVAAALGSVQRQSNPKHYQIFYLNAIRGLPPEQVAAAAGVAIEQVYVVKNRLKPLFEAAVKAIERHDR